MSLLKERSDKINLTRWYSISQVKTVDDAVTWLSDVRKIPDVSTNYFYFVDLINSFDEGTSESVQLEANVSLNDMEKCARENSIDVISLIGEYDGHPVVVGVDLYKKQAYITIRKKDPADIDALERELNLL